MPPAPNQQAVQAAAQAGAAKVAKLIGADKPGIKSTEFYLTLIVQGVCGAAAAGYVSEEVAVKVAGLAGMVLTGVIYVIARWKTKASAAGSAPKTQ